MGFIIGRNGSFTKFLGEDLKVHMSCYRDKGNRALKYDESVVVSDFCCSHVSENEWEPA